MQQQVFNDIGSNLVWAVYLVLQLLRDKGILDPETDTTALLADLSAANSGKQKTPPTTVTTTAEVHA